MEKQNDDQYQIDELNGNQWADTAVAEKEEVSNAADGDPVVNSPDGEGDEDDELIDGETIEVDDNEDDYEDSDDPATEDPEADDLDDDEDFEDEHISGE